MSNERRDIIIFNKKIASELVQKGYRMTNMQPNSKDVSKTVYYFENTVELVDLLKDRFNINIGGNI